MTRLESISQFFQERTGLVPQLVTCLRQRQPQRGSGVLVWSIMTEQGHFYVVEGRHRELFRARRSWHGDDAYRRYLDLHPDERPTAAVRAGDLAEGTAALPAEAVR